MDEFLLYCMGPYSDLKVGYLRALINGTTVTVQTNGNATSRRKTSRGFNLVRSTNGVYALTHPKCQTALVIVRWNPVQASGDRSTRVLAGADAQAGTATIEISASLAGAAADPSSENNELEVFILMGHAQ